MNHITITGRITRDPELKVTNGGTEVCNFSVAVDRRKKDADGNRVSDFFDVTALGKTGVFVSTYFHKGDGINVEGRMESRKWSGDDGKTHVSWSVQADNIEFPHGKGKGSVSPDTGSTFTELPGNDGELPF